MSMKPTFQRTPEEQIETILQLLDGLHLRMPEGTREAKSRRSIVRHAISLIVDLRANLAHIEETGELKTFGRDN